MNRLFKLLTLCLILIVNSNAQSYDDRVSYELTLIPVKNKTDLKVKVSTKSNQPLIINELRDKYGTPNIHDYVKRLNALKGNLSTNKDSIFPNKKNEIELEYTLSFDVEKLKNYTYSPNTSENNFHAFNCQWMINLGSNDIERLYSIQMTEVPEKWDSYNSYTKGNSEIEIKAAYHKLFDRVLGATNKSKSTYFIAGQRLDIFIHGDYQLDKKLMLSTIKDIIVKQREFFNDFDFDFYNVIVVPKEHNVAGVNVSKNTFVCYLKEDIDIEQLSWIIAHEVFHTWLGSKINVKLEEDARIYRDHWFTEGFTDYFASKIRLDAGIITHEQFKNYFNTLLINVADNPYSNYTLSELETLASSGGYGTAAVKLQYYRGALIALNIEAELVESKSGVTLKDILNEMLLEATKRNDRFSRREIFTLFKKYDLDLEPLFNAYIIQGQTIKPKSNALGDKYQLVKKAYNIFDFGLDYYRSKENGIVRGVDKNSEAYKAGLRDGQKFIALDYGNRFGAAWKQSDLVSVKVSESGEEKELRYLPKGQIVSIFQYETK